MFKSGLQNLFNSKLKEFKIKDIIRKYLSNESIIECLDNEGTVKYIPAEYLNAITYKDVKYLY